MRVQRNQMGKTGQEIGEEIESMRAALRRLTQVPDLNLEEMEEISYEARDAAINLLDAHTATKSCDVLEHHALLFQALESLSDVPDILFDEMEEETYEARDAAYALIEKVKNL